MPKHTRFRDERVNQIPPSQHSIRFLWYVFKFNVMALKTRFCVKCGKETKKLVDGYCAECFFKNKGIVAPKKLSIQVCQRCKAIKWHGIWTKAEYSPEHYLAQELISKIKIPDEAELEKAKITKFAKNGEIEVTISLLGKKFVQRKQIIFDVVKGTCKNCSRFLAKTHKVKIQLRTEKKVEPFVMEALKFSEKYQSNIIKFEKQKRGVDIYLSNKEAGKHLAYELRNKFNCKMSESIEQYGWNKSKNRPLTRTTYLVKQR